MPKQKVLKSKKTLISEAKVTWDEDSRPTSFVFDDYYLDGTEGTKNRQHAFLEKDTLTERWNCNKNLTCTIGETGFGAGLNFLITAEAWLKSCSNKKKREVLNFVSVENSPLPKKDLIRILSLVPELSELSKELIDGYPPAISGIHKIYLSNKSIILTLMYGDACDMFSSVKNSDHPFFERSNNPVFDAWFLDGFSPKSNPSMWSSNLFEVIADLSYPGTIFSASTSEHSICKKLARVGFSTEVRNGNAKRDGSIYGVFVKPVSRNRIAKDWESTLFNSPYSAPWYLTPEIKKPREAIVIGGGIAGCCSARALAERGISVTLIERHQEIGQEASGNSQGILYPKLSTSISDISRFGISALISASKFYSDFLDNDKLKVLGDRCGVVVLPKNFKDRLNFEHIASLYSDDFVQLLEDKQLDSQVGLSLTHRFGLFFPRLGWISPPEACRSLVKHSLISISNAEIKEINLEDATDASGRSWKVMDDMKRVIATAPIIVIASAYNSGIFHQTDHLPLRRVRGQTTAVPPTEKTSHLKTILCGKSYILPIFKGTQTLGATYNPNEVGMTNRIKDHKENISRLGAVDLSLTRDFKKINTQDLGGRASFRCTTPDFLPIAGPAPKLQDYIEDYKFMRQNARAHIPIPGSSWEGLYLNTGHGSRGLSYAPMCAELVASQICNEVPPLELDLRQALHPGRFIIRDIKRNKL